MPEEILVERSTVQRSSTTGQLVLTCPKARISDIEARNMRIGLLAEEKLKKDQLKELELKQKQLAEEAEKARKEKKDAEIAAAEKAEQEAKDFLIRKAKQKLPEL